ncbi:DUF1365 domain-containing protein [Variovorax ureilyticus]|uniref:DUF1365 domain-containing protein n=1 Tax=Variovorax ureilyticus TaxID=1836198 RepID=UPI003D666327
MSGGSALYAGSVMHRRLRPVAHRLRYRVFWLLVDLDELPALSRRLRLFSLDRFNVFSLRQRDYGDGGALRARVEQLLRASGLSAEGAIHLLTMPRLLGYAFNPLNVYFCHRPDGVLHAVLYEVNNTFGARHTYLIEVNGAADRPEHIVQHCAKQLHVSPFLDLDMRYRFDIDPPRPDKESLRVGVTASDLGGTVLTAVLDARRQPLNDLALLRTLVFFPFVTLKVIVAIHWEAMWLWLKGLRPRANPGAPPTEVTIIKSGHIE